MTSKELEKYYSIKQLQAYNSEIRSKYNSLKFQYDQLNNKFDIRVETAVKTRTAELEKQYKNELSEKDKQIEALKKQIAKMQSIMDNDASNSGIPTSKTAIGKKKYIPNTREKTNKKIGGQSGHKKHKLVPFGDNEVTEIVEISPTECNKCHSKEIERLETSVDKQELDYEVKIIKRENKFVNFHCKKCGNEFHATIPNDLKEEIQYGKTVQSLAVCLTNEIYTPFNKTVKLINGLTNGEINMSEGYVAKLQKRASNNVEKFIEELKKYIPKQAVYGWDDGVVSVNKKDGILRTYCTDKVALFIGHENKNEKGLDEDGILMNTAKQTIVMHDHILHNYNEKYNFDNVECMIHLIRRLRKMKNNTNHDWNDDLEKLLSKVNADRNKILKENKKEQFDKEYLKQLDSKYDEIILKAKEQNKEEITVNYFKDEEKRFIKDLIKYKRNYLLWAYNFSLPSTNNNSERNIRPIKSKLKISGQFQNINYVKYYANIRSYIETCKKNGINIIDACVRLMNNEPYTLDDILSKDEVKKDSD